MNKLLSVYHISNEQNPEICSAYIAGGLEKAQKIYPDIKTVDDIIICTVELWFLHSHTGYTRLLRRSHDKDNIIEIKNEALRKHLKKNPSLTNVPSILKPKIEKLMDIPSTNNMFHEFID